MDFYQQLVKDMSDDGIEVTPEQAKTGIEEAHKIIQLLSARHIIEDMLEEDLLKHNMPEEARQELKKIRQILEKNG